jgi:hypothetical protein
MLEEKHSFLDFENGMSRYVCSWECVASTKTSMSDTLLSVPPGLDRGLLSSVKQGNHCRVIMSRG